MLVDALLSFEQAAPGTPVLVADGEELSPADLLDLIRRHLGALAGAGARNLALVARSTPESVAAIAAASALDLDATLLGAGLAPAQIARTVASLGIPVVAGHPDEEERLSTATPARFIALRPASAARLPLPRAAGGGRIGILTSGTTGEPKRALHAWLDLRARAVPAPGGGPRRWLLAYPLSHFAGLQVLLYALLQRDTLVMPGSGDVLGMWRAAQLAGVTHLSSTPTFWRMAKAAAVAQLPCLRHVTLGGEIVTQDVLDHIARSHPAVTVSQVYASTELGSIVSVRDRRPGLPWRLFEAGERGAAQLAIADSELLVRRAVAGGWDWLATGDLVERRGDRVLFLGRRTETINVGGVKVHPHAIEAAVAALDEVTVVRAAGDRNPISGQIVRLDVVLREGARPEEVERRIHDACRPLGRHAQPRRIRYLDAIETTNGKLTRRDGTCT